VVRGPPREEQDTENHRLHHREPRDPNGKLYKRKLRDPYWQGRERAI